MTVTRKHLQHFRTSGTSQPSAQNILHGEIALSYGRNHEKLFIKNSSDTITEFSSDEQLKEIRDTQDGKVAEATGLITSTDQETGIVSYEYQSQSDMLNDFDNMNESVDFLAGKVKDCIDEIGELKSNYIIDTNFNVEANSGTTTNTVSYNCKSNGITITPKSCTITKYVNNGSGIVILNNTNTSSATTTSNITGNKEKYVLDVTPDLSGATNTRSEITRYVYYVGSSSATTMTSVIAETFNKYTSDGVQLSVQLNTTLYDYIWVIVPTFINVQRITSNGITVTLDPNLQTISNTLGTFKCYKSYNALDTAEWPLVIYTVVDW